MIKLKKMMQNTNWSLIVQELKAISTVDLTSKAANYMEKLFWGTLGIIGIIWAIYFTAIVIKDENPIIKTIQDRALTETEKPAITICPHGSTKFTVAERLGNFLAVKADIPNEIVKWQHMMMLCGSLFSENFRLSNKEIYEEWCVKSGKKKEACQVSSFITDT